MTSGSYFLMGRAMSLLCWTIQSSSSLQSTRRDLRAVGAKVGRVLDVDMDDLVGRLIGVPVQEDADTAPQRARHVQLVNAHQRHVPPAQLPRRQGRKLGVQVVRRGKNRAGDVFRLDAVLADHQRQQLPRGLENLFRTIIFRGRGAADSSAKHHSFPYVFRRCSISGSQSRLPSPVLGRGVGGEGSLRRFSRVPTALTLALSRGRGDRGKQFQDLRQP